MRSIFSFRAPSAAAIGTALLLAIGCSDEARVSFTVFPEPGHFGAEMVTVRFSDGQTTRTLTDDDFVGDIAGRTDTPEFGTQTSGSLDIEIEVDAAGVPVASGMLEIPLKPDGGWNVVFNLGQENPYETCIGCFDRRNPSG